jgi:4-aminobutyrate aminotransferase-like enzyme
LSIRKVCDDRDIVACTPFTDLEPALAEAAGFVRQYCLEHNVLIGVGGNFGSVLRIQLPLVISHAQLETVFSTVGQALETYGRA